MKFLQMYASSQTLNSAPTTPINKYYNNNSPSSSGGATSLSVTERSGRGVSSASSSTLTAGSDHLRAGTELQMH